MCADVVCACATWQFEIDVEDPVAAGQDTHAHGHSSGSVDVTEHGHASEHGHAESEHGHAEGGAADCDTCKEGDEQAPEGSSSAEHAHAHSAAEAAHPKRKKKHDLSGVGSLGLTATTPLISHEFNAFMSDLLRLKARDLYRSKGVLAFVEEGDAKFIFQGVYEQIQYTTAVEPWGADEARVSKVVFIGRDLDHEQLRAGWAKCQSGAKKEEKKGFLSNLLG